MIIEIHKGERQDSTLLSGPERQLIANLEVAYGQVQLNVSQEYKKAFGDAYVAPPAPALFLVPNADFALLVREASAHTEALTDRAVRRKEVFEGKRGRGPGAFAGYINTYPLIIIPEFVAKAIQRGGLVGAAGTLVLQEEYLHHMTTEVTPEGEVGKTGFVDREGEMRDAKGFESGVLYRGTIALNDDPDTANVLQPELIEASGEQSILLTEHATKLANVLIGRKLFRELLAPYVNVAFIAQDDFDEIIGEEVIPSDVLLRQVLRALKAGKPNMLNIEANSAMHLGTTGRTVNILDWLSEPTMQVGLTNPLRNAGTTEGSFAYDSWGFFKDLS